MFKFAASPSRPAAARWARLYTRYAQNDQIYIHDVPASNALRYSFSSNPDAVHIGHTKPNVPLAPREFAVNPGFVSLVQKTIGAHITDDFTFVMEGGMNASSFMPIYDLREIPRYARTPDIENVFGYVQVDDQGKMVPGSYQDNVMYRVFSGTSGLPKLSDYMYEQVQSACEQK